MPLVHLIYDFDGTIADSYALFLRFWNEIAEKRGIQILCDQNTLYRELKKTAYDAYKILQCEDILDYDTFLADFHALQEKHRMDFQPFPEAVALLKRAKRAGKRNYLYTHTGPVVKDMLSNMGLLEYFDFILDASYRFPLKPAPDALLFLQEHLSLDPKECVMIGDRPIDALAGQNAGMKGCLWDAEGLFDADGIDFYIKRLEDVAQIVGM